MTSTVLDVTVLLLCVSASVVALGAADSDRRAAGPEVAEVADLIVTETVTVTYASAEAPNGTRTVHATRAELLALVAAENEGGGGKRAAREAFESEALAAIDRGIGPRTRVDAEVRTLDETEDEAEGETGAPSPGIVVRTPRWASNGSVAPTTGGTGIPWRIDRRHGEAGSPETEDPTAGSESPDPVTVGSEPPRGADVTVAVITHPAPNAADAAKSVRIVIRRW
ncbi:DUF7284 family protein [Halorubrum lacusprofundi]|uniref:Uncharacterized protein n=1 Tax=Halorubrum lacusprofundi (strain ATCC 49239 / DSM 5036 / JCM 8891 / ACAM 34) TaxID=416348 RepID=B9LRH3_HALLT|nr:hypothetical protein [Halorubrum lacusprofundi]ACM55796.1 hypothetical protein Hlac_0191 [Halorubrum lacusprofundi ATCC 49239]MCG1006666.1 hypothetical protein [Halorubrum lacusprofundi]